jgi:uncharacterized membrane protein YesL
MKIDPESRSLQGLTTFVLFVVLNVLYLVTCAPVVTIGAATSALYEVTLRYADDERGDLVRGYLVALRRNVWKGTAVFLALGVPAGMLAFSGVFWLSMSSVLSAVAGLLAVLGAWYLVAAVQYGLALVGWFEAPLARTLRNALLLPPAEPARTLGLLLLPIAVASIVYVVPQLFFLVVTIGFSFGAYVSAFVLHSVFRRRQADPSELEPVSPHSGQ